MEFTTVVVNNYRNLQLLKVTAIYCDLQRLVVQHIKLFLRGLKKKMTTAYAGKVDVITNFPKKSEVEIFRPLMISYGICVFLIIYFKKLDKHVLKFIHNTRDCDNIIFSYKEYY